MVMKPVISVVMPAYNEEKYIEKSLKSLRNQKTKVPYEIIVCDNNSTDRTVEIAKKYADKVVHEERQGIAFARNTAIAHSKGKYLANVDADTIYPPDYIERIYEIFKTNKYVAFSCGKWDYCESKSIIKRGLAKFVSTAYDIYLRLASMRNTASLPGWSLCTPRWVFDKVGGFDTSGILDDAKYSKDVEEFGIKKHFSNIEVHSSARRFTDDLIGSFFHYIEYKHGLFHVIWDLFRRSKYR